MDLKLSILVFFSKMPTSSKYVLRKLHVLNSEVTGKWQYMGSTIDALGHLVHLRVHTCNVICNAEVERRSY